MLELVVPHSNTVWRMRGRGGLPELRAWEDALLRSLRPRWQSSMDTGRCNVCSGAFGLLRWQHHCRGCGFCVCASCSSVAEDGLPRLGYEHPVRLCSLCQDGQRSACQGVGEDAGDALAPYGHQPQASIARKQTRGPLRWAAGSPDPREPLIPPTTAERATPCAPPTSGWSSACSGLVSAAMSATGRPAAASTKASGMPRSQADRIREKYGIPRRAKTDPPERSTAPARCADMQLEAVEPVDGLTETCVMCLDRPATVVAAPCGHCCLCEVDSRQLGLRAPCPLCRAPMEQLQRRPAGWE